MKLAGGHTSLRWQADDGAPGWFVAGEDLNVTANLNMDKRKVVVFACGASDAEFAEMSNLMASVGLPFPASDIEFAYGVMSGDLGQFTVSADEGIWRLEADF